VISVDPGVHCGWARWQCGVPVAVGHMTDPDAVDVWTFFREHRVESPDVLVVEGQWYRATTAHRDDTIPVAEVVRLVESNCALRNAELLRDVRRVAADRRKSVQRAAGKAAPFNAVMKLIESRCAWQHAAQIAGLEVHVVPARWVKSMCSGAPGERTTDRIRWVVERRWPESDWTEAERAAVLLGQFWIESQRGRG